MGIYIFGKEEIENLIHSRGDKMWTELKKNIDWVGYADWNVRDFHSYDTRLGATYNAYLIRDEKTALIDTVKAPFAANLLQNIRERTDLAKVDYVVCNHAEMDHSGALPEIMSQLPGATLVCNAKCRDTLAAHFDISSWRIRIISPEDSLNLGTRTLSFVNIPMVHWPESMVTYLPNDAILFSNDAFGQHVATTARFDDQWNIHDILSEAKSYYANIVTPYGRQVLKTLEVVRGLKLEVIAPSHGLIWRKYIPEILSAYQDWASGKYRARVGILYDTMWESTGKMAEAIESGIYDFNGSLAADSAPVDAVRLHVRKSTLTRIATEMLDTPVVALGSSTLNAEMMPQMAAVLTYIKGLKFREKSGLAFGSYGWGPGGPEAIQKWLELVKYPIVADMIKSKYRPTPEVLEQCRQAGRNLAELAMEKAGQ